MTDKPIQMEGRELVVIATLNGRSRCSLFVYKRSDEHRTLPIVAEDLNLSDSGAREAVLMQLDESYQEEADTLLVQLAAQVAAERTKAKAKTTQQDPAVATLEIWADEVDGADLLRDIHAAFRRFLFLGREDQYTVLALWVVFAHAHDAFRFSPILIAASPEKGSGKTRMLEVLSYLTPRPWLTSSPSDAVVFRKIDKVAPTFLLDEGDNVDWRERKELLSIFNAGYQRRSASVPRCVGEGANLDVKDFSTWCPKALSCIKVPLPDTTVSRSIVLHFKKKTRSEAVEDLRERTAESGLTPLARRAARWASDNFEALRAMEPAAPDSLSDRSADAWEPLFCVADLAGGEWPGRARSAALYLNGDSATTASVGVMMLTDIKEIFTHRETDRLRTSEIESDLKERDDRPWTEWSHGRAISGRGIAKLLKPFGIEPRNVRDSGGVFKGYLRSDFTDAWGRYLPDLSATTLHAYSDNDLQPPSSATRESAVADLTESNLLSNNVCSGVADKMGVEPDEMERGDAWEPEESAA